MQFLLKCGEEQYQVKKGDSFFLPAGIGEYFMDGSTLSVLCTRVGTI